MRLETSAACVLLFFFQSSSLSFGPSCRQGWSSTHSLQDAKSSNKPIPCLNLPLQSLFQLVGMQNMSNIPFQFGLWLLLSTAKRLLKCSCKTFISITFLQKVRCSFCASSCMSPFINTLVQRKFLWQPLLLFLCNTTVFFFFLLFSA